MSWIKLETVIERLTLKIIDIVGTGENNIR